MRIDMPRPVDRKAAEEFIVNLASHAGLRADQWTLVQARPLSKQYVARRTGEPRAVARRVAFLLVAWRGPDGD